MNDARATDPATSHAAADDNTPRRPTQRTRALHVLASRPFGLTDFELAELMTEEGPMIGQTSAGKRRHELVRLGLVRRAVKSTGGFQTRPSPTGSAALVWQVTGGGAQYAASGVAVPRPPDREPRDRVVIADDVVDGIDIGIGEELERALAELAEGTSVRIVLEVGST